MSYSLVGSIILILLTVRIWFMTAILPYFNVFNLFMVFTINSDCLLSLQFFAERLLNLFVQNEQLYFLNILIQ